MLELNKIYCWDCLEVMKQIPDKSIDLVLTDPPYGLWYDKQAHKNSWSKYWNSATSKWIYIDTNRDNLPDQIYFDEIFRISKNQIIFWWEHLCLMLPKSRWRIVRDKNTWENNFSDCELAWTSFNNPVRKFEWTWNGMIQEDMNNKEKRMHPTQKPVPLFRWILENYSEKWMTILDPFLWSWTTAVACKEMWRNFIGIEKEEKYCKIAEERLKFTTTSLF